MAANKTMDYFIPVFIIALGHIPSPCQHYAENNSKEIAPTYTKSWTTAKKSACSSIYIKATPKNVATMNNALCTRFEETIFTAIKIISSKYSKTI